MRSPILMSLALATAALTLSGCVLYRLPGIPMQAGAADPALQQLARRALRDQDAYAQLELGMCYEEGRGVPVDWKYAEGFYKAASTSWGGGTWNSIAGMRMYVGGQKREGLPEAKARLEALQAKRARLGR